MPETVTLSIGRPVEFPDMGAEDYRALLTSRAQAAEAATADKHYANGVGVLGGQRIPNQDWRDSPTSHAPRRNRETGVLRRRTSSCTLSVRTQS